MYRLWDITYKHTLTSLAWYRQNKKSDLGQLHCITLFTGNFSEKKNIQQTILNFCH